MHLLRSAKASWSQGIVYVVLSRLVQKGERMIDWVGKGSIVGWKQNLLHN